MDAKKLAKALLSLGEVEAKAVLDEIVKIVDRKRKYPLARDSEMSKPGFYLLVDKQGEILYVGETGNICKRHRDLFDTRNHSFRRSYGNQLFSKIDSPGSWVDSSKKRFADELEDELNQKMGKLFVIDVPVWIGRKEIEETYIQREKQRPDRSQHFYNIRKRRK